MLLTDICESHLRYLKQDPERDPGGDWRDQEEKPYFDDEKADGAFLILWIGFGLRVWGFGHGFGDSVSCDGFDIALVPQTALGLAHYVAPADIGTATKEKS